MNALETSKSLDLTSGGELAAYHQQLIETYKNSKSINVKANPDNQALMAFNGYYALNGKPGAFFAIDTNMIFSVLSPTPVYMIRFLISLDGRKSSSFDFSGSFSNNQLIQSGGGLNINLTFSRPDGSSATTASVSGVIVLPGDTTATSVSGVTYNNPIPSTLFCGVYSQTIEGTPGIKPLAVPAMEIKDNYELQFDNFSNNGSLTTVPIYVYNMNMYFFTALTSNLQAAFLIMGTGGAGGLVCNNMDLTGKSRTVQTIVTSSVTKASKAGAGAERLAQLSGYYQLPNVGKGAFLSIQGQYKVEGPGASPVYKVMIALSYDGVSSNGWGFDSSSMSFNGSTLSIPEQSLTITFNRKFNSSSNALVAISGNIKGYNNIMGYTLFNPVPLSAFGGAVMTDDKGNSLTVVSDVEVIYVNGVTKETTVMNNIIYVPLMYILAYPHNNPTTEMSFGTNGTNGNTCIVTDKNGITVVSAITG